MLKDSYSIITGKGISLYCQCWQPSTSIKATLFIVHGLGEHSGRYEEMATTFVDKGIAVFSFDHRGHGQSGGKKGHAQSIDQLIEDTEVALMKCRSVFLENPIFIYGHSMGGQIAASFLKKVKSKEISGAIISSAWFKLVNPPPSWQLSAINAIKKILPQMTLSNGLDPNHISSEPAEVELYQNDEHVHDQISFALFNTLYTNGLKLLAENKKAKVPVLICHGDGDKITSHQASQAYANNLGQQARFISWEGAFHEPHHDKDKTKVIDFYSGWVLSKIS